MSRCCCIISWTCRRVLCAEVLEAFKPQLMEQLGMQSETEWAAHVEEALDGFDDVRATLQGRDMQASTFSSCISPRPMCFRIPMAMQWCVQPLHARLHQDCNPSAGAPTLVPVNERQIESKAVKR